MKALKAYFDYAVSEEAKENEFDCSMFNESMHETAEEKILNAVIDSFPYLESTNWQHVVLELFFECRIHVAMTKTEQNRLREFTLSVVNVFEHFYNEIESDH